MTWIDISVPVNPATTPTWPGSPPIRFEPWKRLSQGDECDDTTLHLGIHTGTHIDAPSHFLANGATVDAIPLHRLLGPCRVLDLTGHPRITADVLAQSDLPLECTRVLLKTDNSGSWSPCFEKDFVGLTEDGAQWFAARNVGLLGNDYLSVQAYVEPSTVHRILLDADVVLLEGIDLDGVAPGDYQLFCAPLRLVGTEGAPARALLRPMHATSLQG